MRITDVRTVLLTGPCTNDPYLSQCRRFRSAAFIEVHTDGGLVGIGESYNGYRCAELYPQAVEYFKPILMGRTVDDVPRLWQRMYQCENFWCRAGFGIGVINGIEAALWDLKGKIENKPVYELLGGLQHDALDAYATGGPSNYPKDRLAAKIDHYMSHGFRGVKLGSGCLPADGPYVPLRDPAEAAAFEADKLAFVRARYGDDLILCLDGHMGNRSEGDDVWDVDTAAAVCNACEPYSPFFFEEPLHYDDPWGYAELCTRTSVPIAGGECLTGLPEWRMFIEKDCFDIGQPDASFTGGLKLCVDVAMLLHQRGRRIATHAWGAGASFMQNIHVGFACPNTTILEIAPDYGPLHSLTIGDNFILRDGRVLPPTTPGLGVTLSADVKRRFAFVPGSGEFNDVPGKSIEDADDRVAAVLAARGQA